MEILEQFNASCQGPLNGVSIISGTLIDPVRIRPGVSVRRSGRTRGRHDGEELSVFAVAEALSVAGRMAAGCQKN